MSSSRRTRFHQLKRTSDPPKTARAQSNMDLIRDYENIYDKNAIKIMISDEVIGYIEKNLAQLLAPDIDCGLALKGSIIKIEKKERTTSKVKIRIELK